MTCEFDKIEGRLAHHPLTVEGQQFADTVHQALVGLMSERKVSVQNVADRMRIPLYTFRRNMKGHFGIQPARYLMHIRLRESLSMLREYPKHSVSEIALACGFYDKVHFTHTFVQQFGMSPINYIQTYFPGSDSQ